MQVDLAYGDILTITASKPEYLTCVFILEMEEAKSSKDLKRWHKVSPLPLERLAPYRRTNAGPRQNERNSTPLILHEIVV